MSRAVSGVSLLVAGLRARASPSHDRANSADDLRTLKSS